MKRIISFLLTSMLLFSTAACTSTPASSHPSSTASTTSASGTDTTTTGKTAKYRVAYVARTLSDQFAAWLATEIKNQAKDYADTFSVDVLDSQGDSEKQNSIIETCITKKYDCIIIQPNDGEMQRPYAKKVVDAGVKCITTNAKIPNLEGSSSVDADPYEQGKVLADDAVKRVPKNARVVLMSALPGNLHTTSRMKAYKEIFLKQRPDVKLLAEVTLQTVSEADAMSTFEDWVQSYGQIDAVLTVADELALADLEVVKDNPKYKNILAYGVNGISKGLLKIKSGEYTATCQQDAAQIAALNLKAAKELLTGEKKQVNYKVDAIFIDKTNVQKYIDEYVKKGMLTQKEADSVQ